MRNKIRAALLLIILSVVATLALSFFKSINQKTTQAESTLPDKGIVIFSFADAYLSAYTKGYPAISSRGWKAVAWVNPSKVGQSNKMTEANLVELNQVGWDISSHGWSHNDPTLMTDEQLTQHLKGSQDWLVAKGFTRGAQHYSPPSAHCDERVYNEAIKYYRTIKMPQGHICHLYPTGFTYTMLGASDNVPWDTTLKPRIDTLVNNSQVLMLAFHEIVDANPGTGQTSLTRLNQVLDYVQSKGLNVLTTSDFLDYANSVTPTPTPVFEIVVDNQDASFSKVGGWGLATTSEAYKGNTNYAPVGSGRTATWQFSVPSDGYYQVYGYWSISKNSTETPYHLYTINGEQIVKVNQTVGLGQWNLIGTYQFSTASNPNKIVISNDAASGTRVEADAIKIVPAN